MDSSEKTKKPEEINNFGKTKDSTKTGHTPAAKGIITLVAVLVFLITFCLAVLIIHRNLNTGSSPDKESASLSSDETPADLMSESDDTPANLTSESDDTPATPASNEQTTEKGDKTIAFFYMPDLIGLSEESALAKLDEMGFYNVTVEHIKTEHPPKGYVIRQSIPANTTTGTDFEIILQISE